MGKVLKTIAMVAAIGALIVSTGGLALFGTTAGITLFGVSAATLTLVSLGAGIAATLLTPNPKIPGTQMSRLTVGLDPSTPRKAVFGTTAMPLDIRYHESSGTDQEYVDYIVALAAHKVTSIDEIWFEEKQAWTAAGGVTGTYAGYLTITTRTEGSAANYISINGGGKWGSSRRLTGCAYLHIRIKRTGNTKKAESPLVSGLPSRVTVIGNGALLYDPRKDSTVVGGSGTHRATDQTTWGAYTNADDTDNPALQLLWWLLGWKINGKLSVGCGVPSSRIDIASFITAANICDEDVTLAIGGTQKRYRTSGTASDADDRKDVINTFLMSMNGTIRDNGGKLKLTVMKNDLAQYTLQLDETAMLGEFDWQQTGGLTENYNLARGRYIDPSPNSLYQMIDYPEVGFASPDGVERVLSIDLAYVEDGRRAQRIANQMLQRNQYRGVFSTVFNAKALGCQVGDVVLLSVGALGFSSKPFRVISQEIRFDGQVPMALIEENAAIYAWDANDVAPITPTAPTIYNPLNNPFILGLADVEAVADGKIDSFYQATAPAVASEGDYWTDTDDSNKLYRYTTGVWTLIRDTGIPTAISAAAGAQATADGKVTTFYVETTPTAIAVGDLWYKPSTKYLTRWNGTAWADVATVGAKAGTNLLDSTGATLADAAIITSQGTAANITGQAATATSSDFSVITGTTKPANNATVGAVAGTNLKDSGGTVLSDAAIKNSQQLWAEVSGTGRPENNATVGARSGTNLFRTDGTTVLTQAEIRTVEGTAAAIAGQGAFATLQKPVGILTQPTANLVFNSGFTIGKQGWNNQTLWYINLAPDGNTMAFGVGGERFILSDPFPTSNYSDMVISYEGFAHLTTGNRVVALRWLDGSQAMISDAGYIVSDSWGRVSSAPITPPSNAVYGQVIIASGAVASGGYSLFRRIKVEANQYGSATPYSDEATNGAIYRNGLNIDLLQPQEIGSNVTETRTAAAIANQAATATSSDFSAVTGTTKPANNATVGARSGTNLYRSDGTTVLSQAEIRTAEGTAAGIAGQGALATRNEITASSGNAMRFTDNLIPDNEYRDLTWWGASSLPNVYFSDADPVNWEMPRNISINTDRDFDFTSQFFTLEKGSTYRIRVRIWNNNGAAGWSGALWAMIHIPNQAWFSLKHGIAINPEIADANNAIVALGDTMYQDFYFTPQTNYARQIQFRFKSNARGSDIAIQMHLNKVQRLGRDLIRSDTNFPYQTGDIQTNLGTASAIANQAATATSSDFSAVTGTTKPANNANNTYVDGNGAVQGVSSGAGTVIDNSYTSTPNNLIPNSDQTSAMTMAQGYNPNGATFDANLQYASNVGGWVGAYILSGTTTRNLYVHQNNITAGGNDAIALDIYPTGSFTDRIPVVAGAKYIMSCYAQGHRCGGSVGLYFYNQAGTLVGDFASAPQSLPYSGAATLSEYARLFVAANAPAGAASAAIYVRKHNTQAGNTESYFWLAAPQLERVNANATVPGPYVPGPALSTRQLGFSGELNADYTLTAQITTQSPDDVTINADYLGNIIAGQFNKITTPIVTKAGVSVRTDNRATYTVTNITGGLSGFVSINNTNGSADKGRATVTNCTSSGSYNHNIFWDGVLIASYVVRFHVVPADPPLGGGGSGGTGNKSGSFDSTGFTVSSTSFVVVGTITNLTKASGETIRCSFPSAEYQVNATTTVTRSIVAKWQYSPTGANSWTDVGSAVTGTASSWDSVDVSGNPGFITVNQNVAPSDAAYDLRLVAAMNTSGNSITFQFGTASVLIGV